ncbi:hypothetical protein [Hydrogenophaga sp.]|uniref:hypothetical protein n=1 Tax=Hydrogenophaga sp. TaxID=1904254 RepID=UPI00272EFFBA|nr:hypothetical protein [Hydrogenophaga sp.]MDP1686129.1 hypothetical protein [Hydrogenophaga sp.]
MNSQDFCTLINAIHAAQGHPERRARDPHAPMPAQSHHATDVDWAARLREKNFNTVQVGPHQMHLGHCAERVPDHLMIHVPIGICFDDPGLMLNLLRFNATTQATNLGMGHFSIGRSEDGEDAILFYRAYLRVTPATPAHVVLDLLGRLAPFAYASANECLSEVAELDNVNEDLGPHGPVRPGHGGLGAVGDFDQHGEPTSEHGNGSETDNASEHSSHGHPMSEDESSEAVLETPPPSPRLH